MQRFVNKKLAIITALALALSSKVSANENLQQNIDINSKNILNINENSEIISERFEEIDAVKILENYKKQLEKQTKNQKNEDELVNNIIKILDSFPDQVFFDIVQTASEKFEEEEIDTVKILEDYKKQLEKQTKNQKDELVNNVIKILDSFPDQALCDIVKSANDYFMIISMLKVLDAELSNLGLNKNYTKNDDEKSKEIDVVGILKSYKEKEEAIDSIFEKVLTRIKEDVSPEIISRINLDILELTKEDLKNKFASKENNIYILAGIVIPILKIFLRISRFINLESQNILTFDLNNKTLNYNFDSKQNSCKVILTVNNDESLTVKFSNNKKTVLQFTLKK